VEALLKRIDRHLVQPSMGLLPPLSPMEFSGDIERILVIRPGGLGDALLLLPSLVVLHGAYPHAELVVLAEPRNAQAFSLLPFSCRVVNYTRMDRLLALFMEPPFDVVIDTEQWYGLSALVARFMKGTFKVGFDTSERKCCFHRNIDYSHHEYEVEAFFRLFQPVGVKAPEWWPFVPFQGNVPFYLQPSPVRDGKGRPAIFTGASHLSRRWGKENFLEVVRFLAGDGWKVAVVGGYGEKDDGEYMASSFPDGKVLDCTGSTSLRETVGALSSCSLLITADSSVMHLAWLLRVPTLSLFGPGILEKWAPRGPGHMAVKLDMPCSPCTRFGTVPPCPHDYACMRDLTPEMVVEALRDFMASLEG